MCEYLERLRRGGVSTGKKLKKKNGGENLPPNLIFQSKNLRVGRIGHEYLVCQSQTRFLDPGSSVFSAEKT